MSLLAANLVLINVFARIIVTELLAVGFASVLSSLDGEAARLFTGNATHALNLLFPVLAVASAKSFPNTRLSVSRPS
jgi:hypothetical protein